MGMVNFDLWHIYKQAASEESSHFHEHAMPPGGLLMNQPVDISVSLSAGNMSHAG